MLFTVVLSVHLNPLPPPGSEVAVPGIDAFESKHQMLMEEFINQLFEKGMLIPVGYLFNFDIDSTYRVQEVCTLFTEDNLSYGEVKVSLN